MSKQTLVFNDIEVHKKDFQVSEKAILINSVNTNNIVISYRVKHNDDSYKYFIGYLHDDDVIRPMFVILPQMSGYIKYFENGGKNMSFTTRRADKTHPHLSTFILTIFYALQSICRSLRNTFYSSIIIEGTNTLSFFKNCSKFSNCSN